MGFSSTGQEELGKAAQVVKERPGIKKRVSHNKQYINEETKRNYLRLRGQGYSASEAGRQIGFSPNIMIAS